MSLRLEMEYENELAAIRHLAKDFAREHPSVAGKLILSEDTGLSQDPHVERLIEAFAYLTARVQIKLKDEFPELVDALLGMLYPHYLSPLPSMAIAQMHLDGTEGNLTGGVTIDRGAELFSREIAGLPCRFRTTAPVTIWPIQVSRARYQSSPFGSEIIPSHEARDAEAALRINLRGGGGAPLTRLGIRELRFFLSGDLATSNQLYELLFNHVVGVQARVLNAPAGKGLVNLPANCLRTVGFEENDGMLPYGPRSFPGYRLLTEYFAFPYKFLFFEIPFDDRLAGLPAEQEIELLLFLNRPAPQLENRVSADSFRLACAPIVNLFQRLCEPIRFTRTKTQYLVVPDARRLQAMEIYTIDEVESIHPDTKQSVRYQPFYGLHQRNEGDGEAYWHHQRQPSPFDGDSGTDVYLVMTNEQFEPAVPANEVVLVRATCTNRNMPADVQRTGGVDWQFQLTGQSPVRRISTPVEPTPALRIDPRSSRWRLISHLALNHLSITGGPDAGAALREILRLYDYAGSNTTSQQIDGIASVSAERSIAPIRDGHTRGFCRGLDVAVTFDDDKYPGTGFYLLASVLERFLAQYASINSFTRLVARSKQREYWQKRWSPRTGNLTLA